MAKESLLGQQFGRWKVISAGFTLGAPNGAAVARCVCGCGVVRVVLHSSLKTGKSKSCGCLKREVTSRTMTTHGMSSSVEYRHYAGMLARCSNKDDKNYQDYGARGITVCEEFVNDFMEFYQEVGPKPQTEDRWSIGRIDNNKGYIKGNIRWELDSQQARNHSLQKNNTSGVAGICIRYTEKDGDRVVARYNDLSGKRLSKSFSVGRYGLEKAMELATAWRNARIEELNALGADYAASHGTRKVI